MKTVFKLPITFKAKVVADISNVPKLNEPTYEHLKNILTYGNYTVEFVMPWSADSEPTLIITEEE